MATLANLNVLVGANVSGLTRGLRSAEKGTRKFSGKASRDMKMFGASAAAAASHVVSLRSAVAVAAGAAGLGLFVAKSASAAQETYNYARAVGTTTESLSSFGYAAQTVGIGQEKLNDILKDTAEKIGDAYANEGGEAVEVIERLNLNVAELARMSPDKQMLAIAEGLQQVGTQGERVQIMEALASDASLLLPLLEDNAAGLRRLQEEAVETGAAFGDIDAVKVAQANQSLMRTGAIVRGVGVRIASELSPYIEAVANHLVEASKESGGFRTEIISGIESMAMGVGYLANTFRGLHVVWKGLEVAFAGIAEGIWNTFDMLIGGIDRGLSKLPFVGDKFGGVADVLSSVTGNATARTRELQAEFDELIMKPMPTHNVKAFFTSIRKAAEEAAQTVAESRKGMGAGISGDPEPGGAGEVDAKVQERLARMKESFLAEDELLKLHHKQKRDFLLEADARLFESEHERDTILQKIEADHQSKLLAIEEKGLSDMEKLKRTSWTNQSKTVLGSIADMTAGVAQGNRAMFEINKVAALAEGALSLKKTVMDAYEWGNAIGGPVVGGAYAAIAGAAQVANLAQIAGTSFGGGTAPSVGGTSAPAVTPISQQEDRRGADTPSQTTVSLNIGDDVFMDGAGFRRLIDRLNEQHEDGYKLRVT